MTEVCILTCFRPRSYSRLLHDTYPVGATGIEKNLEAQKLDRLIAYAAKYPKKIPLIGAQLRRQVFKSIRGHKYGFLKINLEVFRGLIPLREDMHIIKSYLYDSLIAALNSQISTYILLVHDLIMMHAEDIDLGTGDMAVLIPPLLELCSDSGKDQAGNVDNIVLMSMKLILVVTKTIMAGPATTLSEHIPALARLIHSNFHVLDGFLEMYTNNSVESKEWDGQDGGDAPDTPVRSVSQGRRSLGGKFTSPRRPDGHDTGENKGHAPVLAEEPSADTAAQGARPLTTHDISVLLLMTLADDPGSGILKALVDALLDAFWEAREDQQTWRDRSRCLQILDCVSAAAIGCNSGVFGIVAFLVMDKALEKSREYLAMAHATWPEHMHLHDMRVAQVGISALIDTATHLLESIRGMDAVHPLILSSAGPAIEKLLHVAALTRAVEYFLVPSSPAIFPGRVPSRAVEDAGVAAAAIDGELATGVPIETSNLLTPLLDRKNNDHGTPHDALHLPHEGAFVDEPHVRRGCTDAFTRFLRELLMQIHHVGGRASVGDTCFFAKVLATLGELGGTEEALRTVLGHLEINAKLWFHTQAVALLRPLVVPRLYDRLHDTRVTINLSIQVFALTSAALQGASPLEARPLVALLQDIIVTREWDSPPNESGRSHIDNSKGRTDRKQAQLAYLYHAFFVVMCSPVKTVTAVPFSAVDQAVHVATCWRLQALLLSKRRLAEILSSLPYVLATHEYSVHLATALLERARSSDGHTSSSSLSSSLSSSPSSSSSSSSSVTKHAMHTIGCQRLFFCAYVLHVATILQLRPLWTLVQDDVHGSRKAGTLPNCLSLHEHCLYKMQDAASMCVWDLVVSPEGAATATQEGKAHGDHSALERLATEVISRDMLQDALLANPECRARQNEVKAACQCDFDVRDIV